MNLLTCENVTLAYDGKPVLTGLNFQVNQGDYLCIVGENGSGKSTLIKSLLGLHKPLFGTITLSNGLQHHEIGYLPQQTAVQRDFPASVWEVVLSGFLNSCSKRIFFPASAKDKARSAIRQLSLDSILGKSYQELSGGQQQRVLLARALCATQKMLLLDEPTAGMDPFVTKEMYTLLQDLNQHRGITILMVSHDIAGAVEYASHILHLGGKQLFFGTTTAYLHSPLGRAFAEGRPQ